MEDIGSSLMRKRRGCKPWRWIVGILFLGFLSAGCAEMMAQIGQQPKPAPAPSPPGEPEAVAPEAVEPDTKPDTSLKVEEAKGKDVVVHQVRPGETLSGIAMTYYGTYLTDVYFHVPFRQFMTAEVSRPYEEAAVRKMGTVAEVIARLNERHSSRLKVGSEIVLPRILGLPFQKPKQAPEKAAQPAPAKAAVPKKQKEKPAQAAGPAFNELMTQGRRYFERGQYAAAIDFFSRAHGLNPQERQVLDLLHKTYAALGEEALREKDFLRAANAFTHALRYDDACGECREKKTDSETRFKEIHYKKGLQYFEDEQLVKAIEEWEQVQKLDPDYQSVQKNIELARRLLKRLGEMEKGEKE